MDKEYYKRNLTHKCFRLLEHELDKIDKIAYAEYYYHRFESLVLKVDSIVRGKMLRFFYKTG